MAGPFPGMDPYLESRDLWADVHSMLVPRLRVQIAARLPEGYLVRTEERLVVWPQDGGEEVAAVPDVAITDTASPRPPSGQPGPAKGCVLVRAAIPEEHREHLIRVFHHAREHPVVDLELLSYSNKLAGEDRDRYLSIRGRVLTSACHLVEIDLLRSGKRMPMADPMPVCHYLILVSPATSRPTCRVHPFDVTDPIPAVQVPLLAEDRFELDVGRALAEVYDECRYGRMIDYGTDPRPRFRGPDSTWVRETAARA